MTEETLEMEEAPRREKKRIQAPRWAKFVLLFALFCGLLAMIPQCLREDAGHNANVAGVAVPPTREASRVGFGNEEYNRKVDEYAEQRSNAAREQGDTYIPPNTGAKPIPREKERPSVESVPQPALDQPRARKREAQPEPSRNRENVQRMQAYMSKLMQPQAPVKQEVVILNAPPARIIPTAAPGSKKVSAGVPDRAPGLKPGDILYAVNRVSLDSDAPGPAMAEIIDGAYRGAKVLGSFKRLNKHLTLVFSSIVTRSGLTYKIEGYAIDPRTDRTAVRTGVDNHILERWGGLIAASFLEGFGNAVSRSGTSAYSNQWGGGYSTPNYDINEELWIAAGNVGTKAAGIMERNFDKSPTVTLRSGTDIGILLISLGTGKDETIGQGINGAQQRVERDMERGSARSERIPQGRPVLRQFPQ